MMDPNAYLPRTLQSPGFLHKEITPSPNPLTPRPRVVVFQTAGTVTVTDEEGRTIPYTRGAGDVLRFSPYVISESTAEIVGWY